MTKAHYPPDLDLDVIRRALADHRSEAFAQFYRHYGPTVRWAVGYWVSQWPALRPHLDDIVQGVWLELWRYGQRKLLLGYDPSRRVPFACFLALLARRQGVKICKKYLRHPTDPLDEEPDDGGWDFTLELVRGDVLQKLAKAVKDDLDERRYTFFVEHFIRGRRVKDVGADLGMKDDSAFKFRERLTKRLVHLMQQLLDTPTGAAKAPRGEPGDQANSMPKRQEGPGEDPEPGPPSAPLVILVAFIALAVASEDESVSFDFSHLQEDDHE